MDKITYDDREPMNPDQKARMEMLMKKRKFYDPIHGISGLVENITNWHHERNLIDGSSDKDQVLKLMQELGELSDSVCKEKDIKDDIGDMLVVMINICVRNDLSLYECLRTAYEDIKDRKGRMVDGIFVKEDD
tara:strand:+ start:17644 stop:18042 length:399 start_codon:yes stop_codon:yes gene_type:complete